MDWLHIVFLSIWIGATVWRLVAPLMRGIMYQATSYGTDIVLYSGWILYTALHISKT